jgi:hypothetical protein
MDTYARYEELTDDLDELNRLEAEAIAALKALHKHVEAIGGWREWCPEKRRHVDPVEAMGDFVAAAADTIGDAVHGTRKWITTGIEDCRVPSEQDELRRWFYSHSTLGVSR